MKLRTHSCRQVSAPNWFLAIILSITFLTGGCSENTAPDRADRPASATPAPPADFKTALDEYVAAPDTNYSFHLVDTLKASGYTTFVLEMTSQAWLTTNEVDRPVWKHWVNIVRPDTVQSATALLVISGGANDGKPPKSVDGNVAQMAAATKSIVAELKMIPNQPLTFAGDSQGRKEDSLIAYTWDKFLRTGDSKWPARLPMTKAAVRAMDTITAFCGSQEGGKVKVETFMVAGGSKRGWTTWTTAAVDKRVIAIAPMVIDVLSVQESLLHHYGAYGFWAPAIGDYTNFHIMEWSGTPEFKALMAIEDPYEYRHRLTLPKFIVNASGDQFFLPDSSQFYFDDLPGVKYLRYIPNTDHSLKGSDAYQTLTTCFRAVVEKFKLPQFSWTLENDGSIRVTSKDAPSSVMLWQATNPDARDFRLESLGPKWENSMVAPEKKGVYVGKVAAPAKGWTAFYLELAFPSSPETMDFKFTTQVRVLPDVYPHKFVPARVPKS